MLQIEQEPKRFAKEGKSRVRRVLVGSVATVRAIAGSHAGEEVDAEFRKDLLELIPFLRAFARSLCGERELADDLAQEALTKAWKARASFQPGSNLKAWLFMILRNQFYSHRRRAWRQAPWDSAVAERIPTGGGEQTWSLQLSDTARALKTLPAWQREALILVGAGGYSYESAAKICNCPVGTMKSRVVRARKALIALLDSRIPLPDEARPAAINAANEIAAQLDSLAPLNTTSKPPSGNSV